MDTLENKANEQLDWLIALAQADTDDGWAQIDSTLSQLCNKPDVLAWARNNTSSEERGLRDLSATILEASDVPLTSDDVGKLLILMNKDEGFPGFRAACALAKRIGRQNVGDMEDAIKEVLRRFADDDDVSKIARGYLQALGA